MKRVTWAFLLGLLLPAGGVSGQSGHDFRVAPVFGLHFGDTKFDLESQYTRSDSSLGSVRSELVFPLDVSLAGIELVWRKVRDNHPLWTASARLVTAVSEPDGKFTDRDWDLSETIGWYQFSSTASTVDGSLVDLELEITRLLAAGEKRELAAVVGLGYQKIKQKALDLKGSQSWVDSTGWVLYEIDYDGLSLTYELRYLRPQIGLIPRFRLGSRVSAELRAVISPFLHAKDIDDHVLRYFQSRTDGKGLGYSGRLALAYESGGRKGLRPFGRLVGEVQHARVKVSGRREYYCDNPAEGYLAGEGFPEERTITSLQYGVRLHLGVAF